MLPIASIRASSMAEAFLMRGLYELQQEYHTLFAIVWICFAPEDCPNNCSFATL